MAVVKRMDSPEGQVMFEEFVCKMIKSKYARMLHLAHGKKADGVRGRAILLQIVKLLIQMKIELPSDPQKWYQTLASNDEIRQLIATLLNDFVK